MHRTLQGHRGGSQITFCNLGVAIARAGVGKIDYKRTKNEWDTSRTMEYYFRKLECEQKCNGSKLTSNIRPSQGTRMGVYVRVSACLDSHSDLLVSREKMENSWSTVPERAA